MLRTISEEKEQAIISKFIKAKQEYYKSVDDEFKEYKNDPNDKGLLKCLVQKHSFLKRHRLTKRSKIALKKAYISEILEHSFFKDKFSEVERRYILEYHILKIRGLYKHAQALKTGFCNGQIINGFSEENTVSICITKNTLEANEQWLRRLFKELDHRYPHVKLNDKILIISSKVQTLDNNASHCKDINTAWSYLKRENNFKIIFMCSNKTRIQDIYEIAESFSNLNGILRKDLRIFHDEAHNNKEGIPPFRDIIENIITHLNVLSYQPITASNHTICLENNPLWRTTNIENNAINFTEFDQTKSDNPAYSSCNDAIKLNFEFNQNQGKWTDYGIEEVSRDLFIKVTDEYKEKRIEELDQKSLEDIDRRRKLDYCPFMRCNNEIEAVNNGLNCLNLNNILGVDYFEKKRFNLHLISTPNRKIITRYLAEEAIKKDYRPIVLAIYGNQGQKYHLFRRKQDPLCVDHIMGEGEFNEKLYNLIKHMAIHNQKPINRPIIIIGNYTPTGESLTFVNYHYGTVKGNIRLISTNAEEDYQNACRGNYMNTKFIENDPNWTFPTKYLIGPQKYIDNALSYEKENDARIDDLLIKQDNPTSVDILLPSPKNPDNNSLGTVAIPIKIMLDRSDPNVEKLISISIKTRKNQDDKKAFLEILKQCVDDDDISCSIEDQSGKFDFNCFTLKDFRCYTKKEGGPKKGQWKFKNYQEHFRSKTSFINDTNNHNASECEILICRDKYLLKNKDGGKIEENETYIWWMGYKY